VNWTSSSVSSVPRNRRGSFLYFRLSSFSGERQVSYTLRLAQRVFLPHDAEATSTDTGKTRVATFRDLWPNVDVEIVPKVHVDVGIAKGRAMFARLWVDSEKCKTWLDYVSQYRQEWDESRGMFLPKPYHDFTSHAADVHRYAALMENQMTNEDERPMEDSGQEEHDDIYD
jgi:hypothetical protein